MNLTSTPKELKKYLASTEYLSRETIENFRRNSEQEERQKILSDKLESFIIERCPNCGAYGFYRWHFLGKLKHPDCRWSWYVKTGTYIRAKFKDAFSSVFSDVKQDVVGSGIAVHKGCFDVISDLAFSIASFFLVILPITIMLIPIQLFCRLTQPKPKNR